MISLLAKRPQTPLAGSAWSFLPRFAKRGISVVCVADASASLLPSTHQTHRRPFQTRVCFPTHLIPIPSHFPQPPPGFSLSLGPLVVSHAMNGGASSNLSVLDAGVRPKKASSTQRGTSTASYLVLELGRVTVVNQWKRRWSHKSADWRMRACVANIGSQGRVPERREGSGQAHQLQHDGTGPPRQVLHPSHPVPLSL